MGSSLAQSAPDPPRILIILLQGLGDLVLSIPAMRAVRLRFPSARIDLTAPDAHINILAGQGLADNLLPFPTRAWRSRGTKDFAKLLNVVGMLRSKRYGLCINLTTPFSPSTWFLQFLLAKASGSRRTVLSSLRDCICGGIPGTCLEFRIESNRIHERTIKFRPLRQLRIDDNGMPPVLQVADEHISWGAAFLDRSFTRDRPVVGLCLGGTVPTKRYPILALAQVIERIQKHSPVHWLCLGSQSDMESYRSLIACCTEPIFSVIGQHSFPQDLGVMKNLRMLLTNDTGLMHVAAAIQLPVVGLFGPADLRRYAPLSVLARPISLQVSCSPCHLSHCWHNSCLRQLPPEMVATAVFELIDASAQVHPNRLANVPVDHVC